MPHLHTTPVRSDLDSEHDDSPVERFSATGRRRFNHRKPKAGPHTAKNDTSCQERTRRKCVMKVDTKYDYAGNYPEVGEALEIEGAETCCPEWLPNPEVPAKLVETRPGRIATGSVSI